jgi:hypothetical protein
MAFQFKNSKGKTYFLHSRNVELKGGRTQTLYFFAKEPGEGALNACPVRLSRSRSRRTGCRC